MTYETMSHFAQTWGLLFLVGLFGIALGYALWPGNRQRFERAARMPFDEEIQHD